MLTVVLSFALFGCIISTVFWFINIYHPYTEIEKHIQLKNHCKTCDNEYFICAICGCQKETQRDADVCAAWDKIIGKHRHEHTYPHEHDKDDL